MENLNQNQKLATQALTTAQNLLLALANQQEIYKLASGRNLFEDSRLVMVAQEQHLYLSSLTTPRNHFAALQQALCDGVASRLYPVGTVLPDTWIDTASNESYYAPLRIVHYAEITLTSGRRQMAALLHRIYPTSFLVQFDAPEMPAGPIIYAAHGCGRYSQSGLRQYLNSKLPCPEWWNSQRLYDMPPRELKTKDGYTRGCTPELLAAIKPVVIKTTYKIAEGITVTDQTGDFFWLPAVEDLVQLESVAEDQRWTYYKDELVGEMEVDIPRQWLRNADPEADSLVYFIQKHRIIDTTTPKDLLPIAPVCAVTY